MANGCHWLTLDESGEPTFIRWFWFCSWTSTLDLDHLWMMILMTWHTHTSNDPPGSDLQLTSLRSCDDRPSSERPMIKVLSLKGSFSPRVDYESETLNNLLSWCHSPIRKRWIDPFTPVYVHPVQLWLVSRLKTNVNIGSQRFKSWIVFWSRDTEDTESEGAKE